MASSNQSFAADSLRDFTATPRLLQLALMAAIVGSFGAGAAWLLLRLIALFTNLAYLGRLSIAPASIPDHLPVWSIVIPVIGSLVIGLMARYGSEKIRGHGIPEAIEAILIGRSRIQLKVALLKPLSSAISIGTGGPFGAEGPIIMTGGALGSLFAQLFHLTSAERKTLLVAGAAAGMTAVFGTPVAAVLLAVELLLFEWKPRSFVPVAVAAVVAAAWRSWALAAEPLFPLALPEGSVVSGEPLPVRRAGHSGRPRLRGTHRHGVRKRGSLRTVADPLDVVADARRAGHRAGRPDRAPCAGGRVRQYFRPVTERSGLRPGAAVACGEGSHLVDRPGIGDIGWRARSAPDHGWRGGNRVRRLDLARRHRHMGAARNVRDDARAVDRHDVRTRAHARYAGSPAVGDGAALQRRPPPSCCSSGLF